VYESLTLSKKTMTRDGKIIATVTVFNNSNTEGEEVIMLYMHDVVATVARPVAQLIDFKKLSFAPFERKVSSSFFCSMKSPTFFQRSLVIRLECPVRISPSRLTSMPSVLR
jgi:hypothetical protein